MITWSQSRLRIASSCEQFTVFFEHDFGAYVLSVFARNISKSPIKFRALSIYDIVYMLSGRGSGDRFALGCFLPTLEGTAMDAGTTDDGQAAEAEWQS